MTVEVVAAVIERRDGRFLLAQRPSGKVYSGWWEFPGGKVEAGERPRDALARELQEELGIDLVEAYPWVTRVHSYEHATVRLNFFRVKAWSGDPHPREGQSIQWQEPGLQTVEPMLPANAPILAALTLPQTYAITDAQRVGTGLQLTRLEARLHSGLRLVGVREPGMDAAQRARFTGDVIAMAHQFGARVIVKPGGEHPEADGVHYGARDLLALTGRPRGGRIVGASCHTSAELAHAIRLELDFAVLGPVLPTLSHPGAPTLGWGGFARIAAGSGIPVYAIGGLGDEDRMAAWSAGAHGIAMISAAWRD